MNVYSPIQVTCLPVSWLTATVRGGRTRSGLTAPLHRSTRSELTGAAATSVSPPGSRTPPRPRVERRSPVVDDPERSGRVPSPPLPRPRRSPACCRSPGDEETRSPSGRPPRRSAAVARSADRRPVAGAGVRRDETGVWVVWRPSPRPRPAGGRLVTGRTVSSSRTGRGTSRRGHPTHASERARSTHTGRPPTDRACEPSCRVARRRPESPDQGPPTRSPVGRLDRGGTSRNELSVTIIYL